MPSDDLLMSCITTDQRGKWEKRDWKSVTRTLTHRRKHDKVSAKHFTAVCSESEVSDRSNRLNMEPKYCTLQQTKFSLDFSHKKMCETRYNLLHFQQVVNILSVYLS